MITMRMIDLTISLKLNKYKRNRTRIFIKDGEEKEEDLFLHFENKGSWFNLFNKHPNINIYIFKIYKVMMIV